MDKGDGALNIQDSYLGRARRERAWLTVHLNGGKKLTGRIRSFDRYTLILEDRGAEQMIFKHAIATISMSRSFSNAIQFGEGGKGKRASASPAAARGETAAPGQAVPPGKDGPGDAQETKGGEPESSGPGVKT